MKVDFDNLIELTMDEKHDIILDILKDIDVFCRSNGIRYTLSDGTMLGAVRHGGFIPWDDDADILMPREDFDKFVATYRSDRFIALFNTRTDSQHLVYGFSKVVDPDTVVKDLSSMSRYGVFVDVFPLDHIPDDENERETYIRSIRSIHNRLHHRQKKDLVSIVKAYRHSLDWWWNKLDAAVHCGKFDDSPFLACLVNGDGGKTRLESSQFDDLVEINFEDHLFLSLRNQDKYLRMIFGDNYMIPKKWAHNLKMYRK